MSITDELRKYARGYELTVNHKLLEIADRIDGAHDRAIMSAMNDALYHANDESMAELGWVRLPKDADGEYIRVGDVLDGYGKTIEVVDMRQGRSGWVLISRDGNGYADTFAFTHHRAPTVEDVLREFALACEDAGNAGPEVERIAAEYAARLRLVEGTAHDGV